MKRLICSAALVMGASWVAVDQAGLPVLAQGDPHAYFNALIRRGDHWKSYSLRDPAQLAYRNEGGYADTNDRVEGLWVTYNPGADGDRHRQDAAKVVVPAFRRWTTIAAGINASDTFVPLPTPFSKSIYTNARSLKVDNEIMGVTNVNDTGVFVTRGKFGTAAASHAAGSALRISNNSLVTQVRLPLSTTDGHQYLFTWDGYWTDSYLNTGLDNHKAFQFSSGGSTGSIWLEPQTNFANSWSRAACFNPAQHVAAVATRSYNNPTAGPANWSLTDGNTVGPGTTGTEPLAPKVGDFCIKANTWTRFWYSIRQQANDYDTVSAWVADETTGPIQILRDVKVSVRTNGATANTIAQFWLEYNTSTDEHRRLDQRDMVSYFRNFVALRDTGDPTGLLLRPVPGLQPQAGPTPPSNVRVLSTP